ncbi:Detected protein of confused Function [Hibiscus syriacus]|uniref:Detected protein of confused Function n=1 Tax=Hibiscus syriacus TaxID=106335 RepID=A0A6A3B677_HIBSY|nr:Detected protein of confused Function [Hibiscus syriacus]
MVSSARGQEAVDTALKADLVILNTAVAAKWLDAVLKENADVLPNVLWWIHEMRGHHFKLEYVKHLPFVGGAMIDSRITTLYWKNRTKERLRIKMPETYVVHLGNSKELMEVAENKVAKRILREHVRESLGVRSEDLVFALINSVSRGKGQDLFLRSFHESLKLIQERKLQVPAIHAVIVGSDMNAQTSLKWNSARGECFGKITIEAMAFKLPVLVCPVVFNRIFFFSQSNTFRTAAGGTTEIVVSGTTGFLHPAGKEGMMPLANNIVKLATSVEKRLTMGKKGYERVKERFLEHHMSERIAKVLREVLQKAKRHSDS